MRVTTAALIGFTIVAAAHAQSPPAGSRRPDEDAVRAVVRQYVDAREARNPKAVAALFTADSDQLVSSGEWRVGRDDVVSGSLASSAQSAGKRTIDVERVRFVSSDVAIADGRYSITGLGEGNDRRMWSTFVMVKDADGWKIAAIRNMLPAAPAGAK
jgi:uncharacterized protein (TIGR02246 family)